MSPPSIQREPDTSNDVLAGTALFCPACGEAFSPICEECPECGGSLVQGEWLDDRYRILATIAEGGMGIVYEGIQLPIGRRVAIKVMREDLGQDEDSRRRFLREAQVMTKVSHPNVVNLLDYGETADGRLYVVMELLRGHTLEVSLDAIGTFTVRRTCEIALQLTNALVAAHAQGVVHRDLKPSNIVLLSELGDWVKVLDFGLAKPFDGRNDITYAGVVIGTPLYMAPEAVRCEEPDPRTDLYALGCVIHEMLTGQSPFDASCNNLVLVRQLDDVPPPLPDTVPAPLRILVGRLLQKEPDARPASASVVRRALEACLAAELETDEILTLTHAALPAVISLAREPRT